MKVYVASSWRNDIQPKVVELLEMLGHEVYDFKNPPNGAGFGWDAVDKDWKKWTPEQYVKNLDCPIANAGFNADFDGMKWADVCVLVMPCGRSAHSEAGWMAGAGKQVFIYLENMAEPELMYKLFTGIFTSAADLRTYFEINR